MARHQMIIKFRRDTAINWHARNPVLADGEPGFEKDSRRLKVGDGITAWRLLPYTTPETAGIDIPVDLDDHINADEPHPAYDDIPSLTLLYANAKV